MEKLNLLDEVTEEPEPDRILARTLATSVDFTELDEEFGELSTLQSTGRSDWDEDK